MLTLYVRNNMLLLTMVVNRNEAERTIRQSATNDRVCTVTCTIQAVRYYPNVVLAELTQVCDDSLPLFHSHIHLSTRQVIHVIIEHSVVGRRWC